MNEYRVIDVSGSKGSNAFLLVGGEKSALFDCGMAYSHKELIYNIEQALGGKPLDMLFVTHSHYDHLGALPYLRMHWPKLEVVGAQYAQYVLTRPGALGVIRDFSKKACEQEGVPFEEYDDAIMKVDRAVTDREVVDLGGIALQAIELLGHTKCSMGYFINSETLVITESVGCLNHKGNITPAWLTSSLAALSSVNICRQLNPKAVVTPHYKWLWLSEQSNFWDDCQKAIEDSQQFMLSRFKKGMPDAQILKEYQDAYWVEEVRVHQPLFAFEANAAVMLKTVIAEKEKIEELHR